MTENKRFHYDRTLEKIYDYDTCEDGIAESLGCFDACELLNELNDENQQLRKFIMDLQNMIQFDVDNGIKTYPIKLSEYLANVLKEIYND